MSDKTVTQEVAEAYAARARYLKARAAIARDERNPSLAEILELHATEYEFMADAIKNVMVIRGFWVAS